MNVCHGNVQLPTDASYGAAPRVRSGSPSSTLSRRAVVAASAVLLAAGACCLLFLLSPASPSSPSSLAAAGSAQGAGGEQQYDIAVPAGLKAGQQFTAAVPGHRERDVVVPKGVTGGEEISIDVPVETVLADGSGSGMGSGGDSGSGPGGGSGGGSGSGPGGGSGGGPPAESAEVAAQGSGSGSGEGSGVKGEEGVGEVGGEAGGQGVESAEAEEAGAGAVDDVDHFFTAKKEDAPQSWAPGDTQPIPSLPPLGSTTSGRWTSSPLIYGQQGGGGLEAKCRELCPNCQLGTIGWYCTHCQGYCAPGVAGEGTRGAGRWAHFKVVSRAKQHFEMGNPSDGLPDPSPLNLGPTVRIAPAGQAPAAAAAPAVVAGAPSAREPGFVVATTDDRTGQQQLQPPQRASPAQGVAPTFVFPAQGAAAVGSTTVSAAGPPLGAVPGVQVGRGSVSVTTPQVTVTTTQYHPELQKIPPLGPLKFFHKGGGRGSFRHFDGQRLKVLNVLNENEGQVNLSPNNWVAPPKPVHNPLLTPLQEAEQGQKFAIMSRQNVKGGDRSKVGYREYGDVAQAAGEPPRPPRGPVLVPSDPFGLLKGGEGPVAASEQAGPETSYAVVPTGTVTAPSDAAAAQAPPQGAQGVAPGAPGGGMMASGWSPQLRSGGGGPSAWHPPGAGGGSTFIEH